jgi:hypothetical protein
LEKATVGLRGRALLAVLAYTGSRVGEPTRLKVGNFKQSGGHKVLELLGKGGVERRAAPLRSFRADRSLARCSSHPRGTDRPHGQTRPDGVGWRAAQLRLRVTALTTASRSPAYVLRYGAGGRFGVVN